MEESDWKKQDQKLWTIQQNASDWKTHVQKLEEQNAAHLALIDELTSIVDDMDYVLTNVWKPDYKKFHDQFSERCKKALARSRQVMEEKK